MARKQRRLTIPARDRLPADVFEPYFYHIAIKTFFQMISYWGPMGEKLRATALGGAAGGRATI